MNDNMDPSAKHKKIYLHQSCLLIIGSLFVLCMIIFYGLRTTLNAQIPPPTPPDVLCASWDKKIGILLDGTRKTLENKAMPDDKDRTPYTKIFCLNGSDRAITATGTSATDPTFDANVLPNKGIQFLQYALSFLAIIGVAMILWGGFTWMTSGGNEQTIDRARKILLAAFIGLVVITSAWVIVSFVVKLGQ